MSVSDVTLLFTALAVSEPDTPFRLKVTSASAAPSASVFVNENGTLPSEFETFQPADELPVGVGASPVALIVTVDFVASTTTVQVPLGTL